jgi:Peptidase family M1 domain/Peptidase M1 N-terminal domain
MVRKLARIAAIAVLCLGLSPGLALGASYSPGAAGIGDPYYPLDGNGGYDVRHYRLDVSYDPATDRLTGKATISAKAKQNLSSFNLDFVGLTIRSLTVDGETAKWKRAGQELTITPKHKIKSGDRFTVVVRYRGVPETLEEFGLSGFIHTDDGAIVIGEPHVASSWFPADDHPRDKASFEFRITVPAGLEAIANGRLVSQSTQDGQTTWRWDAPEPMATYLAFMAIGQFDMRSYVADGVKYWDAIDSSLMGDIAPPLTPTTGTQLLYSQIGEPAYKRLTRTLTVPPGGSTLTFRVNRDTEPTWDHLFVEARTAGGTNWTTLPDANGHTSQDVGSCPFFLDPNPFLLHYLTPKVVDPGDPSDPGDDVLSCDPTGTSGVWNAASGFSPDWETWSIALANPGAAPISTEVSITYASDGSVQGRGVAIDDIVVSSGPGSTSFEADADQLDGWVAPIAGPEGSADNPNTWTPASSVAGIPGPGVGALKSFDRQPEIIAWEASNFGPYPFATGGGVVDNVEVGFALENQTRPTYSPFFFGPDGNDFVVVHELAHQWFGDSLAVNRWQHIWLNEGFATYAEWMWSEHEGFETPAEIFDAFSQIPADDPFWALAIGDPGVNQLFDFPVYGRGAMTLQALRAEIGDATFFDLLKQWTARRAGGTVTTNQFKNLAEKLSGKDLDDLFDEWLSAGKPASLPVTVATQGLAPRGTAELPDAVRSLAERLKDRAGNPFR